MSPNPKKGKYPFTRIRVYLGAMTAVLSVILAVLLLLSKPIHFLFYCICTLLITLAVFVLDVRFLLVKASTPSGEESPSTKKGAPQWKPLLLLFGILLGSLIIPLLLARVLPPEIWFALIVSLTSGASIAEMLFYFQTR